MLADVALILADHGRFVLTHSTLTFEGVAVAQVNASNAIVLSAVWSGSTLVIPARSAVRGDTAQLLAALILARLFLGQKEAA